ncbi:four helix bundle protein [Candidatus Gottesmanbacteria bacterium]|nr:four helix bundle protein [Candidatus Gottesmanbacteria bacterium]
MNQLNNKYDLEERTAKFGESVILFLKKIPQNSINSVLIKQLVRSATSIGANYLEANNASSRKDFKNKIFICKKEAQETKHWLRMLAVTETNYKDEIRILWKETQELTMIFQKIVNSLNGKLKN